MNNSTKVKQYIEKELKQGVEIGESWHNDYKDSAYVFVGGLNYDMNEGDISTVFSQWGQIVDLRLVRDKKTGRSKGYCFIAYEDQRSTILAVENFNQINLCGRTIGVNHVLKYRPPREYLELKEEGNDFLEEDKLYKPSGPDGRGWGEFRDFTEEELLMIEEEKRLAQIAQERTEKAYENNQTMKDKKYFLDEDERWEQFFMEENDKNGIEKKLEEIKKEQEQLLKGIIKVTKDKKEKKEKKDKKKKKDKKNGSEKSDKKAKKEKNIKKEKKEKKSKKSDAEDD